MRSIRMMETTQIEITNNCINRCSNCTRLIGHHKNPYYMDFKYFKNAVDSLDGFPNMVGIMGGEPLLHPEFEKICLYLKSKVPLERCGLWTCFPEGKENYSDLICDVFGNIFLNDHTRADVLHHPVLVASDELMQDKYDMWHFIEHCWVNLCWSASINPNGAFFCEVAAALAMLFDEKGWEVEKNWWKRPVIEYYDQMKRYCTQCGCAMPILKRYSTDGRDDISPKMFEKIKNISPKVKFGKYEIHDLKLEVDTRQPAAYKDANYRKKIAERYNIFLMPNCLGYMQPFKKVVGRKKYDCNNSIL